LLDKELQYLMDKQLGATVFKQYKEQLLGQIQLVQENRINVLLSLAKSQLNLGKIIPLKAINEQIKSITALEIMNLAHEILDENKRSELVYLPKA